MNAPSGKLITTGAADSPGVIELPEHILRAIRMEGAYREMAIDSATGRVLSLLFLKGFYDSYSDVYDLNGHRWKIQCHMATPTGETIYTLEHVRD
jgi:hypothetical protein